jgi:hypothetical protein
MSSNLMDYPLCAVVTVLVHFLNIRSGVAVGEARDKFNIPVTKGLAEFERVFRAQHYNNTEQYPMFVALMWIFAVFVRGNMAGAMGLGLAGLGGVEKFLCHRVSQGRSGSKVHYIPAYLVLNGYCLGILGASISGFVKERV